LVSPKPGLRLGRITEHLPKRLARIDGCQELLSSVEALAAAYFKNETKQLQSDLEAVRPGLWTDWRITIIKSIKAANALLESLK
jgi:hypothetical protein